jgi:hypothetical protein
MALAVIRHSIAVRNLYAEIAEAATVVDVLLAAGPGKGSLKERSLKGSAYLYWQFRDLAGRVRHHYLGPDDPPTRARAAALEANRRRLDEAQDHLRLLASAFVAAGGMRHPPVHFKVIEALAMGGIFYKGGVLVGSHAFVAAGNMLGYGWTGAIVTEDIDFARSGAIEVGVNPEVRLDVPRALDALDMGFFLVPELDVRKPSTSLQTNRQRVKVDFLTAIGRSRSTSPVRFADLGIAAQPLPFMDYLLAGKTQRGFVIGAYALPVLLPEPARLALHKLVIADERGAAASAKSEKDRRQAAQLILAIADSVPGALREAVKAAPPRILARVKRSVTKLHASSADAAAALAAAVR